MKMQVCLRVIKPLMLTATLADIITLGCLVYFFLGMEDRLAIIREHVRNEMTQFTDVEAVTREQDI